jgi:hypothetical protein
MMHDRRRWTVAEVATVEELAEKLTEHTWCVCNGWKVHGHEDVVFLNDATGGDGAQEYAVCRREGQSWFQIESITFSWCDRGQALGYIRACLGMAAAPATADGDVVVARSAADLRAALLSPPVEDGLPMHVLVTPRIETREEHGRPMCCA